MLRVYECPSIEGYCVSLQVSDWPDKSGVGPASSYVRDWLKMEWSKNGRGCITTRCITTHAQSATCPVMTSPTVPFPAKLTLGS